MSRPGSPLSPGQMPVRSSIDSLPGSVPQTPTTASSFKGFNLNPFSSKITAVLATSYADSEFRDALSLLDDRGIKNSAAIRRQVRLQLQKEVIDSNGDIIAEFGRVADVSTALGHGIIAARPNLGSLATSPHRRHYHEVEQEL